MAWDHILWTAENFNKLRCVKFNLYLAFLRHSIQLAINVFEDTHLGNQDLAWVFSRTAGKLWVFRSLDWMPSSLQIENCCPTGPQRVDRYVHRDKVSVRNLIFVSRSVQITGRHISVAAVLYGWHMFRISARSGDLDCTPKSDSFTSANYH